MSCSSTGFKKTDTILGLTCPIEGPDGWDFIPTQPGDKIAGYEVKQPGAWYADWVVLEQLGIQIRRKTQ